MTLAACQGSIGARTAPDRGTLTFGQVPAVSDQLQGGGRSVSPFQEPGELGNSGAERGPGRRVERFGIARVGASMAAGVGQCLPLIGPHELGVPKNVAGEGHHDVVLLQSWGEIERGVECVELEVIMMDAHYCPANDFRI
jgi:hypothetical protein